MSLYPKVNAQGRELPRASRRVKVYVGASALTALNKHLGVGNNKALNFLAWLFFSQLYRPSFVPLGAATVPTMSAAYPGASIFLPMAQSVAMGPIGSSVPMAYYPVGPVYPPGSTVLVEGGFDAGARFGAGGTASIP
ncbi:PREDICTED: DAZ-associated protein 2, partial [Cariama cristata]